MTLVVVEPANAAAEDLFSPDAPELLHYLLGQGFHGEREDADLWPVLSPCIGPALRVEGGRSLTDVETAWDAAAAASVRYLHLRLHGMAALFLGLATLSEHLGDDDVLAIVAGEGFLVVSASCPLSGPVGRVAGNDLALTLLALSGVTRPCGLAGHPLFEGPAMMQPDDDDEAVLRERFRGLGYVA
jgi:hypothetical protein